MTQGPNRRTLIAAGGAALLMPTPVLASESGTRSFRVYRGGSDIGFHRVSVRREGDQVLARTEIDIAVTVLGFTAYSYTLSYDEVYRGGVLHAFNGTANDDGEQGYARVTRQGDMLEIDGSTYSGIAPGESVPTSYWRAGSVGKAPWISAQSGDLLNVSFTDTNSGNTPAGSRAVKVSDGAEYDVDVWYDDAGDWTGCAFDAGGEQGIYQLDAGSDSLVALAS